MFTTTWSLSLDGNEHILFTFPFLKTNARHIPNCFCLSTAFLTVGTMPPSYHLSPAARLQTAGSEGLALRLQDPATMPGL